MEEGVLIKERKNFVILETVGPLDKVVLKSLIKELEFVETW